MARRRQGPERPIPAHPYRDSALVYGVMSLLLVGVALLTGGSPGRTLVAALAFFVVSTGWSSWRFWQRIKKRDAPIALSSDGASGGDARAGTPHRNGRGGDRR